MESQMDDATNIHGNYATIDRIAGPRCIELRFMHSQHAGFPLLAAGDSAAFSDGITLHAIGNVGVKEVKAINRDLLSVHLSDDLPPEIVPGTLVHNAGQTAPEVEITDCVFSGNRARGILLGSAGKTRVTGNIFHNPGAAILLEGDGKTWFEQAAVRDLTITGNRFENCNFGVWGNAVIEISSPHLDENGLGERCHRNITIVGNTFVSFDATPLLVAKGAEALVFEGNTHEQSDAYPPCRMAASPFLLEHCSQASITLDTDGNRMPRDEKREDAVSSLDAL
jgi:parallel beta-helix repeat protein